MDAGTSRITFEPRPEHLNSFHVTHGGASMTLLDVTMAHAARSLAVHMGVVTIEMKTSFMQPAKGPLTADGKVLHRYLDAIYEEALTRSKDDIWSQIAYLEIEGQQVSAAEFRGIAGVMLAGGRDTVVKLFTGIMWHFGKRPEDLELLRSHPELIGPAIQEFLRFLSPLPVMNRTVVPESSTTELPDDRYVGMSFISGNFDEMVYTNPFEIDFNRGRNPHLSFGFGPHTCLGNHITEIEAKVFLEAILSSGLSWKVTSEEIRYHQVPYTKVPDHFGSIKITAH